MKRIPFIEIFSGAFLLVSILLGAATLVFAAAPANNSVVNSAVTSTTVDCDHSTTTWEFIDSLDVIMTDTCNVLLSASGYCVLEPWDVLYIGWQIVKAGAGTATGVPTADTIEVRPPLGTTETATVYFGFDYLDSLRSQTDDTIQAYVTAAVTGTSAQEQVVITSVRIGAAVADYDAP